MREEEAQRQDEEREEEMERLRAESRVQVLTLLPCFTSTKVHILTEEMERLRAVPRPGGAESVYLLY